AQTERSVCIAPPAFHASARQKSTDMIVSAGDCDGGLSGTEAHLREVIPHFPEVVAAMAHVAQAELPIKILPPPFDSAAGKDRAGGDVAGADVGHRAQARGRAAVAVHRIAVVTALPLLQNAIAACRKLAGRRASIRRLLVAVVARLAQAWLHIAISAC